MALFNPLLVMAVMWFHDQTLFLAAYPYLLVATAVWLFLFLLSNKVEFSSEEST